MSASIKKIAIVGGGAVGWSAALALKSCLAAPDVEIALISGQAEAASLVPIAVSCNSRVVEFHKIIGLSERELVANVDMCFRLGVSYRNWSFRGQDFILSQGGCGLPLERIPFQSLLLRLNEVQGELNFDDYSLSSVAARLGRFGHPLTDKKSILSTLAYGLNIEEAGYAQLMRRQAIALGVREYNSSIDQLRFEVRNGFVRSLNLDDGNTLGVDLLIDCVGLGGELNAITKWNDLESTIPFDRAFSFIVPSSGAFLPISSLSMGEGFYVREVPLKNKTVLDVTFQSTVCDHEELRKRLLQAQVKAEGDIFVRDIKARVRPHPWQGNCVAIGRAAAVLGDIGVCDLQLAHSAIIRLLDYFPDAECRTFNAAEYNRLTQLELERIVEFHSVSLYLARKNSTYLNLHFSKNKPIDSILHKIALFEYSGKVATYEEDWLEEDEWSMFMLGQGVRPSSFDVQAEFVSQEKLKNWCEYIKKSVSMAANKMPLHKNYLGL